MEEAGSGALKALYKVLRTKSVALLSPCISFPNVHSDMSRLQMSRKFSSRRTYFVYVSESVKPVKFCTFKVSCTLTQLSLLRHTYAIPATTLKIPCVNRAVSSLLHNHSVPSVIGPMFIISQLVTGHVRPLVPYLLDNLNWGPWLLEAVPGHVIRSLPMLPDL
ncbi:hypothetical protein TEA_006125 [Camellia sinensis var. sinensis]|uniref:Uncharacterized protein n=1 Tax=Camellia sinensis var. sinensis TaxID=542762 RepID=A0A4S4D363_CAMSN|nr:hypothetical protein TEA_006125 [Camellia sinensis var. sinensis]